MTDAALKADIGAFLEDMGFHVTHLNESQEDKTPDLLAVKDAERYLIEVKAKEDDPATQAQLRAQTAAKQIAATSAYWGPKNTVARIIKTGVRQLKSYPASDRDFCLLWLHANGSDSRSQCEQFYFTLYGATHIFSLFDREFSRECYYFHDSAFFRWRELLDGAVVSTEREGQLCLNSYSPRLQALRVSALARAIGTGLVDPIAREAAGQALLADCVSDRADQNATLQYLQEKYGRKGLNSIHVGRFSAFVELEGESERS